MGSSTEGLNGYEKIWVLPPRQDIL